MQAVHRFNVRVVALLVALLIAAASSGCAIKLVADYDAAAFEEILATAKKVDRFYGMLLETRPDARRYAAFSEQYVSLESDIRGMVMRNQARALNAESTEIARLILGLFVKYKDQHRKSDGYSDGTARLDRNRLSRMFASAASAEEARRLSDDDKDPEKDSR